MSRNISYIYYYHDQNEQISDRLKSILDAEAKAISEIPISENYSNAVNLIVEKVNRQGVNSLLLVWESRANSNEYRHDFLFDRNSRRIPSSF